MARHWSGDFVGIPFVANGRDRAGCDCWGLAVIVYLARCGIILPSYDGVLGDMKTSDLLRVARTVRSESAKWEPVVSPRELDIILFRDSDPPFHIGIAVDRRMMLHTHRTIGASVIEDFTGLQYKNKIEGFFRHAG
jgi:cell wall-associated NlpC family hydrolase